MKNSILYLTFLCYAGLVLGILCQLDPYYNWDMLPYMAKAVEIDNPDKVYIHQTVFESVQKQLPERYWDLAESGEYRISARKDPDFFYNQLPFYSIKPLYIGLVYVSYKCGVPLTTATLVPSWLAYILIAIVLFIWLYKYLPLAVTFSVSLLILVCPPVISLSKLSTPDAICAAVMVCGFYFLIERKSWISIVCFLITIFIRTDTLLLLVLLFPLLTYSRVSPLHLSLRTCVLLLIVATGIYLGISLATGNYVWKSLIFPYHTEWKASQNTYWNFSVIINDYIFKLKKCIGSFQYTAIYYVGIILILCFYKKLNRNDLINDFSIQFAILLVLNVFVRFILFPTLDDRFLIAHFLTIFILAIKNNAVSIRQLSNTYSVK